MKSEVPLYIGQSLVANIIETGLIFLTVIFLAWVVKLALEKDESDNINQEEKESK